MATRTEPTKYPGVTYIEVSRPTGGKEKSYYVTYRDPATGKLKNISVGRQYRDDMTPAKAAHIRGDLIEGNRKTKKDQRAEEAARPTIEALWTRYKEINAHKPSIGNDHYLKKFLSPFLQKVPGDIATMEVEKLKQELFKASYSAQTVKHVLALLKRLIRFGVKHGLCPMPDPSKLHLEMPRVDNVKTEHLGSKELQKLFAALDKDRDQNLAAMMRLALATGMRRGALLDLQWGDIDWQNGFIALRGEAAKNDRTQKIPLNAVARGILTNTARVGDSPYVFPGKDGGKRVEVSRFLHRIQKAAELPEGFRPLHGLRHTYASELASSGKVDLYTLQKLLTHHSPQMTQRYAHLADEALQRAANVAADLFPGLNAKPDVDTNLSAEAEAEPEIKMRRTR